MPHTLTTDLIIVRAVLGSQDRPTLNFVPGSPGVLRGYRWKQQPAKEYSIASSGSSAGLLFNDVLQDGLASQQASQTLFLFSTGRGHGQLQPALAGSSPWELMFIGSSYQLGFHDRMPTQYLISISFPVMQMRSI